MRKIQNELLVCTAAQTVALLAMGIAPAAGYCYELDNDEVTATGVDNWRFAGEYNGEPDCIPAWCMEELHILIGGDFMKPDLRGNSHWRKEAHMMEFLMFLPKKMIPFISGSQAAAEFLLFLLHSKLVTAEECNARLDAFITKERFNPRSKELDRLNGLL